MSKTGFVTLEEFADLERQFHQTQAALKTALDAIQQLQASVIRLNDFEIKRMIRSE